MEEKAEEGIVESATADPGIFLGVWVPSLEQFGPSSAPLASGSVPRHRHILSGVEYNQPPTSSWRATGIDAISQDSTLRSTGG